MSSCALTSMPYAFNARSWELKKFKSIDIFDSLGSSIRIDVSNNKILRIVPFLNESINEEWITNKARFAYDALNVQRIMYPQIRFFNKFIILSWDFSILFFYDIFFMYKSNFIEIFIGEYLSLESAFSLKKVFTNFGVCNFFYSGDFVNVCDFRFYYLLMIHLLI